MKVYYQVRFHCINFSTKYQLKYYLDHIVLLGSQLWGCIILCLAVYTSQLYTVTHIVPRASLVTEHCNLQKITSSFGSDITSRNIKLTPREIEVCNMIEKGFSNKDVANFLNITVQSIEEYRKHIRKKLGLTNKKVNLTSYLRDLANTE